MYLLVVTTLLLAQSTPPVPPLKQLSLPEVLARWEAGLDLIRSYDLSVELAQKTFVDYNQNDKSYKMLDDEHILNFPVLYSRIYRKEGKRRGDFGGDGRSKFSQRLLWDGNQGAIISATGSAQIVPEFTAFGSVEWEDYEAYFRSLHGTIELLTLARQRPTRLLPRDGRLYVVDAPAVKTGDYYNIHWRAWLDPDKNYLPIKMEHWYVRDGIEYHTLDIENDLGEVAVGVFAPTRITARSLIADKSSPLFNKVMGSNELTVVPERSRWNIDIPESLFDASIPNGTTVLDRSRNAVYTQGSGNAEKFLTQMATDEKKKLANVPAKDRIPAQVVFIPDDRWPPWAVWESVAGAGLMIALIGRLIWAWRVRSEP